MMNKKINILYTFKCSKSETQSNISLCSEIDWSWPFNFKIHL